MFIKQNTLLNYEGYKINMSKLIHRQHQKEKLEPSNITEEELLNRRAKNHFQQMKDVALNPESIENDLLMSFQSEGLTFMKPEMNVGPQLMLNETEFHKPEITDVQFIQNFVVKEAFYRDQIKNNFSGEDLKERLAQFEQSVTRAKEKLVGLYSESIGRFFNNEESWIYNDNPIFQEVSQEKGEKLFNVESFKQHVITIMEKQGEQLKKIKDANKDLWQTMIETGGRSLHLFQNELKSTTDQTMATNFSLEEMSYTDMKELGTFIDAIGKGISTNSEIFLGAYLGQMQGKTSLFLNNSSLSENMKKKLQETVQSKIGTKIKWTKLSPEINAQLSANRGNKSDWVDDFRAIIERIDVEKILSQKNEALEDTFQKFQQLALNPAEQFRFNYMNALNSLKQTLGSDRFAIGSIDILTQDWNTFTNALSIEPSIKQQYLIPSKDFSILDERV
ncbi:hypothetical protein SAMN05880501_10560 [Ureibacillus xyleni]|uniref:Uncharacterized protein n=1 Tax=Ureibacillus xyleni TaxID=614648 RepID=A0A285SK82_9BACL|nr:hypothetical protein [Ureibacillus xyleni]SOC08326.1 hypothetical protein SAMN05880501_10560 [Ureibacillus xyleni]